MIILIDRGNLIFNFGINGPMDLVWIENALEIEPTLPVHNYTLRTASLI